MSHFLQVMAVANLSFVNEATQLQCFDRAVCVSIDNNKPREISALAASLNMIVVVTCYFKHLVFLT